MRQLLVSSNMIAIIAMLVILVVHRCHDKLTTFFKKDYRKCYEDVEKMEPLCIASENVKLHNHYGSNLTDPK